MPPRVSIGLPVHNGERHVGAAIRSILDQTFTDFELIISDNASTDATETLCRQFAAADDRVRYRRLPTNVGARANFHAVFEQATGEYFHWAGHDDLLAPAFLDRCVAHLDAHPGTVLCNTRLRVVDGAGSPVPHHLVPIAFSHPRPHARLRAFFAQPKVHQTLFGLHRRATLARTRLFGPWYSSDRALLLELSLHGDFGLVDEVLFVHREHEGRGDYVEDKVAWYTPERAGRADLAYWPHLRWVSRVVATTPMPPAERALCLAVLARRAGRLAGDWLPALTREATAVLSSRAGPGPGGRPRPQAGPAGSSMMPRSTTSTA